MEHQVINVEAQVARRMWDEAVEIERQAREMIDAGDRDDGLKFMERAQATKRAARLAVARAKSLETGTHPEQLEPVRMVPLTNEEISAREELAVEAAWRGLRDDRDALLGASDWTQQPDSPVDSEAWAAYRQKLRDLPAKTKDPTEIKWPEAPK